MNYQHLNDPESNCTASDEAIDIHIFGICRSNNVRVRRHTCTEHSPIDYANYIAEFAWDMLWNVKHHGWKRRFATCANI